MNKYTRTPAYNNSLLAFTLEYFPTVEIKETHDGSYTDNINHCIYLDLAEPYNGNYCYDYWRAKYPILNKVHPKLFELLHEFGHIETLGDDDDFYSNRDYDRDERKNERREALTATDVRKSWRIYYNLKIEKLATKWAIKFIKNFDANESQRHFVGRFITQVDYMLINYKVGRLSLAA